MKLKIQLKGDKAEQMHNLAKAKAKNLSGYNLKDGDFYLMLLENFLGDDLPKDSKNSQNLLQPYKNAHTNKTLTPKHKTYVKAQNNGVCEAEGCNKVAIEVHHKDYQSLNPKNHTNLAALCKFHHRLEHSDFATALKSQAQRQIDAKIRTYTKFII